MGDFDQNENVVDEKLWGEDSDDDEDRIDKKKEKFEENSQVKGEALEDEVRGKDGDEEKVDQSNAQDEDKQKPQLDQSDAKESKDDGEDGKEEMEDINDNSRCGLVVQVYSSTARSVTASVLAASTSVGTDASFKAGG
ncbi:hypothetical protein PsorP6_009949 [Peronosclerospora sorghi]|uniref:Uncharacterized protein n=1 Tax=Peronosclerospora sorghi TaxID=230839 RepID=A0ACC0VY24_9STRA|nr:hypothetical protein PsorP6_009949 [Peronosclerospora sorghi]